MAGRDRVWRPTLEVLDAHAELLLDTTSMVPASQTSIVSRPSGEQMSKSGTLSIQHPDVSGLITVPVIDMGVATPGALLQYLVGQGTLPPADAQRPYEIYCSGERLNDGQSFEALGVLSGATLNISRATHGA